jgi:hypothetical protein
VWDGGERREHALLVGVLDEKRADRRSPKLEAVAAEDVGDRPDVRPARDVERKLEVGRLKPEDGEIVHGGAPPGHLDGDAAPMEAVSALAADLDGRGEWNLQVELAAERLERVARGDLRPLDLFALDVAGRRADAEPNQSHVTLVEGGEVPREAGGAPEEADEEPGGEGVERSRVARL